MHWRECIWPNACSESLLTSLKVPLTQQPTNNQQKNNYHVWGALRHLWHKCVRRAHFLVWQCTLSVREMYACAHTYMWAQGPTTGRTRPHLRVCHTQTARRRDKNLVVIETNIHNRKRTTKKVVIISSTAGSIARIETIGAILSPAVPYNASKVFRFRSTTCI